jgi:hypothetical protein
VIRAIDAYVRLAYGGEPPVTVRSQLATLQSFRGNFFKNPVFVSDGKTPPMRYAARLGNPSYPHMKLAVERAPDGRTWLFRVDTHDGHCLPPMDSPEHEPFARLMADNRALADRIEEAWTAEGLPTFKRYLREDLASRTPA